MIIDLTNESSSCQLSIYDLPQTFTISYSHVSLPCRITFISHGNYYQLEYDDDSLRVYQKPFLILFVNYFTSLDDGHSCYIENIHKTVDYSGSEIMTVVIKFSRLLGITHFNLIDSAKLEGDTQLLSERLLIRSGYSYYQRFGFSHVIFPSFFTRLKYNSDNNVLQKMINKIVRKIKKYENASLRKKLRTLLNDSIMELSFI